MDVAERKIQNPVMHFSATVQVSHGFTCLGISVFQDLILIPSYVFSDSDIF